MRIVNRGRRAHRSANQRYGFPGFVTFAHFTCQPRCALKDRIEENQLFRALDLGAKSSEKGLFLASVTMPSRPHGLGPLEMPISTLGRKDEVAAILPVNALQEGHGRSAERADGLCRFARFRRTPVHHPLSIHHECSTRRPSPHRSIPLASGKNSNCYCPWSGRHCRTGERAPMLQGDSVRCRHGRSFLAPPSRAVLQNLPPP